MAGDAPLLERLAGLTAVPAASVIELLERLARPQQDPVLGPLFGTDAEGDVVVNPLLPAVLQQFQQKGELTSYAALLEGLTGIWNAAVRAAVVARLRASGLPPDDLLIRLQALSPTLGFAAERTESRPSEPGHPRHDPISRSDTGEWAREWLADPFSQDALLVQQCVVRMLLAMRSMAEVRAAELTTPPQG